MSDMKCPFCQQELLLSSLREGDEEHQMWTCLSCQLSAQRKIWQELIRTRKALDVAVDGLEKMTWGCNSSDAEYLLKQIKELTTEQKE